MAQIIDLGSHSFKTDCLREPCLVSRATATLVCNDNTNATEPTNCRFELQNAWITLKQELAVDLHIEAYSESVPSMPNFVKQVVDTIQASLISDSSHLRLSTIRHEYRRLDGPVVLHISVVLRKVPDLSPRILPRRIPRKANICAAEPHPPPGIDSATLSHIAIYMRTLRQCTPWSLFLAKLWLKHPHNPEQPTKPNPKSKMITLCSPHLSLNLPALYKTTDAFIEQTKCLNSGDNYDERSNISPEHEDHERAKNYMNLKKMMDRSLRYLLYGNDQYKSMLNECTLEEGPTLSDVAPGLFKPGHYENVRQRSGLVPAVTRSMTRLFQTYQSPSAKEKISSIKASLRARYGNCTDTEKTAVYIPRPLIKCVVWTALQKGTYKVEWPKQSISRDRSDMILLTDDDLLTECSGRYNDSDAQMINSSTSSETGSDVILSHCSDDIELDSGYSSLSSPDKLFPKLLETQSLSDEVYDDATSGESAIDDNESDLIAWPYTEEKDIIRSSSSPPALSEIFANNDVSSDPLLSSEAFSQNGLVACGRQREEDIMDNSSFISVISSATYQYISADLKEPVVKLEGQEVGFVPTFENHLKSRQNIASTSI